MLRIDSISESRVGSSMFLSASTIVAAAAQPYAQKDSFGSARGANFFMLALYSFIASSSVQSGESGSLK